MLFSSKEKIRSGYGLAFLLLLVSFFLIIYSTTQLRKETNRMTHSYIVINQLETLQTNITQAETSVRGYVITKDSALLNPYYSSIGRLPAIEQEIKKLVADNKVQQVTLDTLQRLVKERSDNFSSGVLMFRQAGLTITPLMESKRERGLEVMDSIHSYIGKMINKEEVLMKERRSKVSSFFHGTLSLTVISLITAILAIAYSIVIYNNEHKAKRLADKKTDQYRIELENNILELKNTNDELKELKSIERFASTGRIARTIAHEVRNPLTNISLAAEQLQEMAIQNNESSMLLDMINRNAIRINQLVSDLLNATKFIQLNMQRTNINNLLDETLEMAKDRIELNHIKVEKDYATDICDVTVDADKIKFAFLNVIVNAIEAMEKHKGILELKTRKEGNKCVVEIHDNGNGMDEDTMQKIFEPYFTAKPKGSGLGLTNTQNVILSHKGSIKVYSRLSQGTFFRITLDIA